MSEVIDEGLRFIVAGPSIVSDWGNPAATTTRAVMTALIDLGHEATYLEPRRDPALVELLRARGSEPMRAFLAAYPRLQYRTVDLPETFQASSWAGQFLSTASAAIALAGCPTVIEDGFRQFESPAMRCFVERMDGAASQLVEASNDRSVTSYQPAVLPQSWGGPRAGTLLVAYDDAEFASRVADLAQPEARVVSGSAALPDWEWVAEADLPARYGRFERVLVVDRRESLAPVRVWLPRANGATAWGVVDGPASSAVSVTIDALPAIDWSIATPMIPEVDAREVARAISLAALPRNVASLNGKG